MRLGVPFIAPRQLGAVGSQQGRQFLPSVGWRTGQSGAPPDSYCSCPVRDFLPFLVQPTVAALGWLAHRTLSGVHRTPDSLVPPVNRWLGPRVAHGLRGRPLLWRPLAHRTVRCTTGQSGAPPDSPVHHRTVRCTTGQSGAPLDSPVNYSRTPPKFYRECPVCRRPAWRTRHCPVHHRTVRCARLC
jgi:hypothetical protein